MIFFQFKFGNTPRVYVFKYCEIGMPSVINDRIHSDDYFKNRLKCDVGQNVYRRNILNLLSIPAIKYGFFVATTKCTFLFFI